eukprot:643437-Lingulodinium_polyedra.AAC.1
MSALRGGITHRGARALPCLRQRPLSAEARTWARPDCAGVLWEARSGAHKCQQAPAQPDSR